VIHRFVPVLLATLVCSGTHAASAQDASPAATPVIREVSITGATVYTAQEIASRHRLNAGDRLDRTAEQLREAVQQQYSRDGYTLATVTAQVDAVRGAVSIDIDEGRFDAVSITGLDTRSTAHIVERLALPAGEIFNVSQANRALDDALAIAQGAIERAEPTFEIVSEGGRRVLRVGLRRRDRRGGVLVGTQGREDWYSPVDALNLALGAQGTVFDRGRFTHTHWSGYVTRKFGPDRSGYSFGIERALLPQSMLQVGGSIQDLTASDDQWRLGDTEQSLVALLFRNTFRDYYRRKGYQVHAAFVPVESHEAVVAWRDESHGSLDNRTDFGVFRDDHPFRQNQPADGGDLRALVLGYTFDSRGLSRRPPDHDADVEGPGERYRRHLLDSLFGADVTGDSGVRVEWHSELAPRSFDHDFDFTRHIAQLRAWWDPSSRRTVTARVIAGGSTGTLPRQRMFALGGIGSVRGYRFKEHAGDGMLLMNGEFRQRLGSTFAALVMLDVGRVYGALPSQTPPPSSAAAGWMSGVGVGLEVRDGGARVEFGWRVDDIPGSLQVLFRLRRPF
jgi:hypothetical protein